MSPCRLESTGATGSLPARVHPLKRQNWQTSCQWHPTRTTFPFGWAYTDNDWFLAGPCDSA